MESDGLSEFRDETGQKVKPCVFSREVLLHLNEEQLDKVADALMADEKEVSNPAIVRVVKRWTGIECSEQSVYRHRKQTCGCFR